MEGDVLVGSMQQMESALPEEATLNISKLSPAGKQWLLKQWAGAIAVEAQQVRPQNHSGGGK